MVKYSAPIFCPYSRYRRHDVKLRITQLASKE